MAFHCQPTIQSVLSRVLGSPSRAFALVSANAVTSIITIESSSCARFPFPRFASLPVCVCVCARARVQTCSHAHTCARKQHTHTRRRAHTAACGRVAPAFANPSYVLRPLTAITALSPHSKYAGESATTTAPPPPRPPSHAHTVPESLCVHFVVEHSMPNCVRPCSHPPSTRNHPAQGHPASVLGCQHMHSGAHSCAGEMNRPRQGRTSLCGGSNRRRCHAAMKSAGDGCPPQKLHGRARMRRGRRRLQAWLRRRQPAKRCRDRADHRACPSLRVRWEHER